MAKLQDRTGDLVTFTAVIDRGSISAAAKSLGVAPSSVSRALSRLEERLGVRLVRRTTRQLDLTPEGHRFYGRVLRILADLEEAESEIRRDAHQVRGRLRVNVSVPFAIQQLIPRLERLRASYPELQVDLLMTDTIVDLIEERADVAIRMAPLADSSLFSRPLANCALKLVASPSYLKAYGMPLSISDLRENHEAVHFAGVPALNNWHLLGANGEVEMVVLPFKTAADNGQGVQELVRYGHGVALLSSFLVSKDLQDGKLVEVLAELNRSPAQQISAVYTERLQSSARLKAFLDFLSSELKGDWE